MKKRIPLYDKILSLGDIQYEIMGVVGEGGSCIVYDAVYMDSVGTPHRVRIKELYPFNLHAERTEDNVLHFLEEDAFEQYKQRFLCAAEVQQKIREESEIVNSSARLYDTAEANGTVYHILEYYHGVPFSLSCTGNLEKYLSALLQTAHVLKSYHEDGYLHLDIKPDNLYYLLPQYDALHTCGKVLLLDFDSIIRKEEANTAVRSYSVGYSAPELKNGGFVSERTDFYSIGAMLFETVNHRLPSALDGDFFSSWEFNKEELHFQHIGEKFFDLLTDFFHKTLATWADDRYSDDDELIHALEGLRDAANVSQPYLESNFSMPVNHCFIGRMQELKEIQEKLKTFSHVFLQGIGGNGKSLLAMQYAWQHRTEYDHILFARYNDSFIHMLCDDFSIPIGNLSTEELSEAYAENKFNIFRELCNSRVLLILDNCDFEDASVLKEWLMLSCHLIITTRMQLSENLKDTVVVSGLNEAEELFNHYCTRQFNQEEQDCIHQLIDYIEQHTMTVELLAKLMRDSSISPEYVYQRFLAADVNSLSEHRVKNVKDTSYQNQSVNTYMDILFALFDFSAEEKLLLQSLILLANKAFYRPLFLKWCSFAKEFVLNHLIYKGWIQEDRNFELLLIHPVIMDRLLLHLPPNAEILDELLSNLTDKLCYMDNSNSSIIEICQNIEKRINGSTRTLAFMQYQLGMCTDGESALYYYSRAAAFYQSIHDTEMLKKIEILEISSKIQLYFYSEDGCAELMQKYLMLLHSGNILHEDPYFCLRVGNDCKTLAMQCQMMMDEGEDIPFWESAEKYYQYAFQIEQTKNEAGERLHDFYSEYFNPLRSDVQAQKYENYGSMPKPSVSFSINIQQSELQEELNQKSRLLESMLHDNDIEGFSALGKELAEYYLNTGEMPFSLNPFCLQDALEKSGQIELLKTVLEQCCSDDETVMRLKLAELYLQLGQPEKAYPLLKQEETHELQLLESDAHDIYHRYELAKIYFLLIQASTDDQKKTLEHTCQCYCDSLLSEAIEPDMLHQETALLALKQAEESLNTGNILAGKSFLNFFAFLYDFFYADENVEEIYNSYLDLCNQIVDADAQFQYYYFTFLLKIMDRFAGEHEQQAEYSNIYLRLAESATEAFGINDVRTALAIRKAAEKVDHEACIRMLSSIDYETITRYEIQNRIFPHQDTNSIYFKYWGECARNYRCVGNIQKYEEIIHRLQDEMNQLKSENPLEYFEALKDAESFYLTGSPLKFFESIMEGENFYRNVSDGAENALLCVLEQWKFQPADLRVQEQVDLCCRIADYYESLYKTQHEEEHHQNEILWLKKALHIAEVNEEADKLNDNLLVNLLSRLAEVDSAQKDYYNKRKVKLQQSKLAET